MSQRCLKLNPRLLSTDGWQALGRYTLAQMLAGGLGWTIGTDFGKRKARVVGTVALC